jgi:hypothetical protein
VDDNGIVNIEDVGTYRVSLIDPGGPPPAMTAAGISKCSVRGSSGPCEILDVSVIQRALEVPPLAPGIDQVCTAATGN